MLIARPIYYRNASFCACEGCGEVLGPWLPHIDTDNFKWFLLKWLVTMHIGL
jgi:hypothetical protein